MISIYLCISYLTQVNLYEPLKHLPSTSYYVNELFLHPTQSRSINFSLRINSFHWHFILHTAILALCFDIYG